MISAFHNQIYKVNYNPELIYMQSSSHSHMCYPISALLFGYQAEHKTESKINSERTNSIHFWVVKYVAFTFNEWMKDNTPVIEPLDIQTHCI